MRLLVLTCRPPWPARRGDQARTAGLVERLAARHTVRVVAQCWPGFDVDAAPDGVAPDVDAPDGVERESIHLETVSIGRPALVRAAVRAGMHMLRGGGAAVPLQAALHDQPRFAAAVRRAVASFRPDVVWLVLSRLGGVLDQVEDVPVVVDLVDALALNMSNRAAREPLLAPLWRREARRLARWDARLGVVADAVTVVAERDRQAVLAGAAAPRRLRPKVHVVPFGLDVGAPVGLAADPDREHDERIVLTGNLGYFPTVDGARWLAREVWPLLRRRRPEALWTLAGARPARAVRRLAAADPRVELVADPPSLRPWLASASVALAPLRAGSGTPIKILEAMAAGVPVVTTPAGAAGLDDLPDDALAVAADGASFAAAVSSLLEDPARARAQASSAAGWLADRHDLDAVARRFEGVLEQAAAAGRRAPH